MSGEQELEQGHRDILRILPSSGARCGMDEDDLLRCLNQVSVMRALLGAFDNGEVVPRVIEGRVEWVEAKDDPLLKPQVCKPQPPIASVPNQYVRGDSSVVRPEFPKKPSPAWRKGFNAGVAAMLVALERGNKVSFPVNGARVFVFAGHHIDEAEAACHAMLAQQRRDAKRARAKR